MNLSIGIVGLPNVGKSTLFKLLTKKEVLIANYPFATIDPSVGVVLVPDERLDRLSKLSLSAKTIFAAVEFYDIAGLVEGASSGEGLGNQFLSHIRNVHTITQVVRCFNDDQIIHMNENGVNPERDIEIINMELILKDLDTINKRLISLEREARSDVKKNKDVELLKIIKNSLEQGILVKNIYEGIIDEMAVKELQLLTSKPQIYLLNGKESDISDSLKNKIYGLKSEYIIHDLSSAEDLTNLIRKAYDVLGLISFFTTGEDETKAWTCPAGVRAQDAAGTIHSDFAKKFIRAEVIASDKLLEAKGWNEAKQKGFIRLEGKEYIVKDGDVLVIRHG